MLEEHLAADEDQYEREPELEIDEFVDDACEQKIQGSQPEHGADVGCVDDKRIARYGEDRGDRIGREDDVGSVYNQQDDKQGRCCVPLSTCAIRLLYKELVTAVFRSDGDKAPCETQHGIALRVVGVLGFLEGHPHSGKDEESTEYVERPGESRDERGT